MVYHVPMPRFLSLLPPAAGLLLALACLGLTFSSVSCSDSEDDPDEVVGDVDQADAQGSDADLIAAGNVGFIGADACAKCHHWPTTTR